MLAFKLHSLPRSHCMKPGNDFWGLAFRHVFVLNSFPTPYNHLILSAGRRFGWWLTVHLVEELAQPLPSATVHFPHSHGNRLAEALVRYLKWSDHPQFWTLWGSLDFADARGDDTVFVRWAATFTTFLNFSVHRTCLKTSGLTLDRLLALPLVAFNYSSGPNEGGYLVAGALAKLLLRLLVVVSR